jgi:hypothetical protein
LKHTRSAGQEFRVQKKHKYDVSYVTIDSLAEGVGSSQILPLLKHLASAGLSVNLISFEKEKTPEFIERELNTAGISWNRRDFGSFGTMGGLRRLIEVSREIPNTRIIHARSDIPAVAASLSRKAPILWDVRSLWAEQKAFIEQVPFKKKILTTYGVLEGIASFNASAMSTLTKAIVPVLEDRHRVIPKIRTVVPTAVNLEVFKFSQRMNTPIKGLYSGTYNNYYDLNLSKLFIQALQKLTPIDIHWARPKESPIHNLNAGETRIFASTQIEMSEIIERYNFGISICKMNAGPSLKAAMPTKIAEFLACGRPVVVNRGLGDLDEFLPEFHAGVILDNSSQDTMEKAHLLLDLLSDPDTPNRCRALAEKYFDIKIGAQKYMDIYGKM